MRWPAVRERRRLLIVALGLLVVAGVVVFVLPQVANLGATVRQLKEGDKRWLALGVPLEALSLAGYIALFRTVFAGRGQRIGWRASYEITFAGVVATKIFAAAGAGGVAVTVWALRASGLSARDVARRMASFEILLYAVYCGALLVVGLGLWFGVFGGSAPVGLTVLPAVLAGVAILLVLASLFAPRVLERIIAALPEGHARTGRVFARVATIPRTLRDGVLATGSLLRHPAPGLLGAVAYWAFDIATLWAAFHAFGAAPAIPVIVLGYFVGMLANALPLPGGIGGVEGGMIGAFVALGVGASAALLGVLAYRALSFWLPTLPGAVAYMQLRRTVAGWRAQGPAAELPGDAGH